MPGTILKSEVREKKMSGFKMLRDNQEREKKRNGQIQASEREKPRVPTNKILTYTV